MSVIRVQKNKNFTVMSNVHLRDSQLSLKAKGLLSVMLSLPDDWSYSIGGLCSICKENETAIKSALKELKEKRYVIVEKHKPSKENNGRFQYEYLVYETPQPEKKPKIEKQGCEIQEVENLCLENLALENHPLYKNTNILNTDTLNTNNTNNLDASNSNELKDSAQNHASSPEEESTFQLYNNKSISKTNYTQEELESYLPDKIRELYTQESNAINREMTDDHIVPDEMVKDLIMAVMYFYKRYKDTRKENHPILSDIAYRKIIMEYLCPPDVMSEDEDSSFKSYKTMINKYFTVEYGKYTGTPDGFNYRISHFMSDSIREHLYRQVTGL